MSEKLTEELLNELLFTKSLSSFIEQELEEAPMTLSEHLNDLIEEKGVKKSEIIKKSKLNTTFAYQLFSGERRAGKDKLLQLSFALALDLSETQRLLKIAQAGELYCKNRRDAIIIYCINKKMGLEETEEVLFDFHEPTICRE